MKNLLTIILFLISTNSTNGQKIEEYYLLGSVDDSSSVSYSNSSLTNSIYLYKNNFCIEFNEFYVDMGSVETLFYGNYSINKDTLTLIDSITNAKFIYEKTNKNELIQLHGLMYANNKKFVKDNYNDLSDTSYYYKKFKYPQNDDTIKKEDIDPYFNKFMVQRKHYRDSLINKVNEKIYPLLGEYNSCFNHIRIGYWFNFEKDRYRFYYYTLLISTGNWCISDNKIILEDTDLHCLYSLEKHGNVLYPKIFFNTCTKYKFIRKEE